jgi:hypothetical protein
LIEKEVYFMALHPVSGFLTTLKDSVSKAFRIRGEVNVDGSTLAEAPQTETDAVESVLTFSENISTIEICNTSLVSGTFAVNGITIPVMAGGVFKATIGGTPAKTVTVTDATSYIVSRYE